MAAMLPQLEAAMIKRVLRRANADNGSRRVNAPGTTVLSSTIKTRRANGNPLAPEAEAHQKEKAKARRKAKVEVILLPIDRRLERKTPEEENHPLEKQIDPYAASICKTNVRTVPHVISTTFLRVEITRKVHAKRERNACSFI